MVSPYAACVCDLKPGDFVAVECGACGHDGLIHPSALPSLGPGTALDPLGSDRTKSPDSHHKFHCVNYSTIPR